MPTAKYILCLANCKLKSGKKWPVCFLRSNLVKILTVYGFLPQNYFDRAAKDFALFSK